MVRRRYNDAQVNRLLEALKSTEYRSKLAHQITERDGVKYASAMRRLQRYVTEAGEKRKFASAPVRTQRSVRWAARHTPPSAPPEPPRRYEAPPPVPGERPSFFREVEPYRDSTKDEADEEDDGLEFERDVNTYDLQALTAYYDGDVEETARGLGGGRREAYMLELASSGTDVFGMRSAGVLTDGVREWFEIAPGDDAQDVEDFRDVLMNLPAWEIKMTLDDLAIGNTTFADWLDAWRDDGMIYRFRGSEGWEELSDSEWWALWRQTYARIKK